MEYNFPKHAELASGLEKINDYMIDLYLGMIDNQIQLAMLNPSASDDFFEVTIREKRPAIVSCIKEALETNGWSVEVVPIIGMDFYGKDSLRSFVNHIKMVHTIPSTVIAQMKGNSNQSINSSMPSGVWTGQSPDQRAIEVHGRVGDYVDVVDFLGINCNGTLFRVKQKTDIDAIIANHKELGPLTGDDITSIVGGDK